MLIRSVQFAQIERSTTRCCSCCCLLVLAHPVRHYVNPFFLVLLVVVITAVGTAGEAASREGWLPGAKTRLAIGVITAIVVYAAGMLSRSRAARGK